MLVVMDLHWAVGVLPCLWQAGGQPGSERSLGKRPHQREDNWEVDWLLLPVPWAEVGLEATGTGCSWTRHQVHMRGSRTLHVGPLADPGATDIFRDVRASKTSFSPALWLPQLGGFRPAHGPGGPGWPSLLPKVGRVVSLAGEGVPGKVCRGHLPAGDTRPPASRPLLAP